MYSFLLQDSSDYMNCGSAPLCGVLTLESGYGPGNYHHDNVSVHGLWPQVGQYGTSQCIQPKDTSDPSQIPSCYSSGDTGFINHEWEKHGMCSGAQNANDFFNTVCNLSQNPLKVMSNVKQNEGRLSDMAAALSNKGYPVYNPDAGNGQLELSACAGPDYSWKLADVNNFNTVCGGGSGGSGSCGKLSLFSPLFDPLSLKRYRR
jgi:hypothetical protein